MVFVTRTHLQRNTQIYKQNRKTKRKKREYFAGFVQKECATWNIVKRVRLFFILF